MREYCKILNPFKYDVKNGEHLISGEWSLPMFQYLANLRWEFTEVELFDKYGNRAITKIQSCDFCPSV